MTATPRTWLDHFVFGINELAKGTEAFTHATGVQPEIGGEHPTLGTHNTLVSLGGRAYLEILAPRPGAEISPLFAAAANHQALTPILWAVATDDLAAVHQALADAGFAPPDPNPGSRVTTDGQTLRWSMFMLGPGAPRGAPFFMEWQGDAVHPSVTSPMGCSVDSYVIGSADAADLGRLFEVIGLEDAPRIVPTETTVTLSTPQGRVSLGAAT